MRALALVLALVSLPVFAACPDLAGKYGTCRVISGNGAGAYDLEITQVIKNRAMEYTWVATDSATHERETQIYRADGKTNIQTEKDPETGMTITLSSQVSCVGNDVKTKMILMLDNDIASTLNSIVSKQGNTLTQVTTGNSMGEEINETVICD